MWETPDHRDHDVFRGVPRLDVPVYFFAGRHDYNTPLALVREYAEFLQAPAGKEVVVFESSAHIPFLAETDRFKEETFEPQRLGRESADGRGEGEETEPRTERVILPFLLYSPETKLGGGTVAARYRRLQPDLPVSSLLTAVTETVRRQVSLEVSSQLHLPGGDRVDASARFEHFPDQFYGVGPGTPDEAEEAYTSRFFDANLRAQRQVWSGLRVGP